MLIVKKREKPKLLFGLRAAIRRLPWESKELLVKYAAVKAGFGGEQQLDYLFTRYKLPMNYRVFHDLALTSSTHFQIDTLFITQSYALVFEVKNIAGKLTVLANPPQLQRTLENGEVNSFKSPVTQVRNNCQLLQDWLHARNIELPIYGAVVLAYSKQRIELLDTSIPFLFPEGVPLHIRNLPMDPQSLDEGTFEALTQELLSSHRVFIPKPICEMFPHLASEFRPGVICPSCGLFTMEKYMGGWRCLSCGKKSVDAHKQAIQDWFLLYGGRMTNKDCREFLRIKDAQLAYRLLQSMDLETQGANRNRTYWMDVRRENFIEE